VSHTYTYNAVVPAAGIGRRFDAAVPKQYLTIGDRTVMEHTLALLLSLPELENIVVAVHPDDRRWVDVPLCSDRRVRVVTGGAERCHSVLAGLQALSCDEGTRVLVHDVARPCCPREDIRRLITATAEHPVGGILALPVSDTLKRVSEEAIVATVDRADLWRAQTPQLFDASQLRDALQAAVAAGQLPTDEAQAIEALGLQPLIVEGSRHNIKITRPEDLPLAAFYLSQAHYPSQGCPSQGEKQ
jgi:2-C-methyl-D-erythritol 4-phosphate cytidylyltransferase